MSKCTLNLHAPWVEAQLSSLSLAQKIGQLIHIAAYSNRDEAHTEEVLQHIREHHIGGLTFFQGKPEKQLALTRQYQAAAPVPLMIGIDAEWGLGMRLDDCLSFPFQMTLGAIPERELIVQMGQEIARQCQLLGIHINYAPVVDVNNNPQNPVIGFRSFGEKVEEVIARALAYMQGMQQQGIMACAKHFPGHGDTDVDSHFALPVISHSRQRLEQVELQPFRAMMAAGVGSIMVAHLHVPSLDPAAGRAASLSRPIVQGLLKEEMGFEGLVITDALDMKGVSQNDSPAQVGLKALLAGNDILLNMREVPQAIELMLQAVEQGQITEAEIEQRCRKVLAAKAWMGLATALPPARLSREQLHLPAALQLIEQLHRQSITVLGNLPDTAALRMASLAMHAQAVAEALPAELAQHELEKGAYGAGHDQPLTPFQQWVDPAGRMAHFRLEPHTSDPDFSQLLEQLKAHEGLLLSLHGINIKARNRFGLSPVFLSRLNQLLQLPQLCVVVFGSPYVLRLFDSEKAQARVVAYQENACTQRACAEVILGTYQAPGRLPVSLS